MTHYVLIFFAKLVCIISYILIDSKMFLQEVLDGLSERGHQLLPVSVRFPYTGVIQANRLVSGDEEPSEIQACSDYRKQGAPDGY